MNESGEPPSLRVLVVSGQELFRAGLCSLLERMSMTAMVEGCSDAEAGEAAAKGPFDVFVVDIADVETDWEYLFEQIRTSAPGRPIVAVTQSHSTDHVRALYTEGAAAVVPRHQSVHNLKAAVQTSAKGDVWLHRSSLLSVLEQRQTGGWKGAEAKKLAALTKRERDIIQTIGKGYRNKQIASELCLSEATVRHYLTSIFSKLGVSDRLELLIYAQQHGLVTPAPAFSPEFTDRPK
jgi:DNA-binding NarL/FixJ family response regulator